MFSADGRHAFFLGTAGDLTTNVPAGFVDVFRRDLVSGTTVLASSRNEHGGRGNGSVSSFSVSANGRWVAFSSRASNLVLVDTNQVEDVFLRDMDSGLTLRISQSSDGGSANEESRVPMLSPDGRFLLFESAASNLVAGTDTNRQTDVFLWDRETGITSRLSNATNGVPANGPSSAMLLSEDGRRVLFRSVATDLVATGDSIPSDMFLWSRPSGEITRIELPGPQPAASQLPVAAFNPVLSSDGRFLAFRTGVALNSVAQHEGVWWFDLEQGTRTRASGGLFVRWPIGHSDSSGPVMSKDGQRIAFEAQTNSTNSSRIRIWSPSGGLMGMDELVNPQPPGLWEPSSSVSPVLSPDGSLLAFETDAAVPAAGVASAGAFRLYLRNLATGETRTPFPGADLEFALPSPSFNLAGDALLFQTTAALPGVADDNGSDDVFLASLSLDRVELVSQRHPELPHLSGSGASTLEPGALSHDGRFVAFVSLADNLVPSDSNGRRDVFVRDLLMGTNVLVSVSPDGRAPAGDSSQPRISAQGRHVVFVSTATNLVPGDTNPVSAVYVRDLAVGTTLLVSARDQGDQKGSSPAFNPQVSASGEWVTFESRATNLVSGVTSSALRLFLRHLPSRRTVLVSGSLGPSSMTESSGSFGAVMDAVGNRIVFLSGPDAYMYSVSEGTLQKLTTGIRAATLSLSLDGSRLALLGSASNSPNLRAVYWSDLAATTNRLIAAASSTTQNRFANVSLSGDGRRVVFDSNFVPPGFTDTNGTEDVFAFDIGTGVLTRVSSTANGGPAGNGASDRPVLSADGGLVAFRSFADNLVAGDTNRACDIFVRNLATGAVQLLSRRAGALGNAGSSRPLLSGAGGTLVFQSWASDLMAGDYNRATDVFAAPLQPELAGPIPFHPSSVLTLKDSPLVLPAESRRGLALSYEVLSGPATVAGNRLVLREGGTVVVRATEMFPDGSAPLSVTRTFTVSQVPQILAWTSPTPDQFLRLRQPVPLEASSSSGLPVTFRVQSGPAEIANGMVTATNVGTVVLVAEQLGDAGHLARTHTRNYNPTTFFGTEPLSQWPGIPRGNAMAVQVVDGLAYAAVELGGLAIFDVRNPAAPVPLGGFSGGLHAQGVQVVGNLAYVAAYHAGLQILDVSNPTGPIHVGGYDTTGLAQGVHVVGNIAYVADWDSGLQVLDVSNPAAPVRRGGYDTSGLACGVHVAGNIAYVADWDSGLQILDVANPSAPVRLGGFDTRGNARAVQVVGNIAYVADGWAGLEVLDVSNPAAPVRRAGYDTVGDAHGVQVVGNLAYVSDGAAGLQVLDVANPASPVRVGGIDTGGDAQGVQVVGNLAYVADGAAGLQIFDGRNPASPVGVGGYNTSGWAYFVKVVGNLAYVADEHAGLQILDVTNPTGPIRVGGYDTSGWVTGVQVMGSLAYVADDYAGLQILDVTNPTAPVRLGGFDTDGAARGVEVVGNLAYVADGPAGLQVLDVSNPAAPIRVGGFDTSGDAWSVQVVGNLAYIADFDAGLQVLDVSNPAAPVHVGGYDTSSLVLGVQIVGNLAYVADYVGGLQVLDVSNPTAPVHLGGYDTFGLARSVQVVGSLAYVADWNAGLQVLDVSNPAAPVRRGGYDTRGLARGVQVVGDLAYVADGEWGVQVLRLRSGIAQSLSFVPAPEVTLATSPVRLVASANSGLPVSFTVLAGPATVVGDLLTLTGEGRVVVRAEQAGDEQFLPAPPVQRGITVLPAPTPLRLSDVSIASEGRFRFRLEGPAGRAVVLQFSTDLRTWFPIATNSVPLVFEPPAVADGAAVFYRTFLP